MRATFRRSHETGLLRAFIWSLLLGGTVVPDIENPNTVGAMSGFDADSLRLLVEEGRLQISSQDDRFRHATDRGQILLTVSLALLGFLASMLHHLLNLKGDAKVIALILWSISVLLVLLGTAASAAVVTVKASFEQVDTTQMSNWSAPILEQLARDYAKAVRMGEITVAARVSVFRQATRLTLWGGVLAAAAFAASA